MTFRDANQDLRAIEGDLIRGVNAAKTEAQKQAVIKRQVKKLEKLPGGINLIFEGQTFGKTPTTETILKASAKKFKDTGYTRQINGVAKKLREDASLQKAALTKYPKCANKAEGGDLATCIATNLIKDSEKLKTGNATQKMVASNRFKDILRKGRRAGQTALSASALPL